MRNIAGKAFLAGLLVAAISIVACGQSGGTDDVSTGSAAQNGPTATRTASSTPTPFEVPFYAQLSIAPDFTLPSANGSPVTLSELASEKPVVLVFYRAFW